MNAIKRTKQCPAFASMWRRHVTAYCWFFYFLRKFGPLKAKKVRSSHSTAVFPISLFLFLFPTHTHPLRSVGIVNIIDIGIVVCEWLIALICISLTTCEKCLKLWISHQKRSTEVPKWDFYSYCFLFHICFHGRQWDLWFTTFRWSTTRTISRF